MRGIIHGGKDKCMCESNFQLILSREIGGTRGEERNGDLHFIYTAWKLLSMNLCHYIKTAFEN